MRNFLNWLGGRKLFAWLVLFISGVVMLYTGKLNETNYIDLTIWSTGFLFASNAAQKVMAEKSGTKRK